MTDYCRLCAESKDPCEIVASISDAEQSIEQKLRACCQWTTENTEQRLPHSVCAICLDKLNKCWLFSQSVQLAQQKLQEIFENEVELDIEIKPLATEIVQTVYDYSEFPNNLSSSQIDASKLSPLPCRKEKKKVKKSKVNNPLETHESEAKELNEAIHECPECGRCFQRRWNLTEHMQRHSDNCPFECWLCHKAFKTKRSLRVHCKNQSENKCEICLSEFCTTTELNAHMQLICEPPKNYLHHSMVQFNVATVKVELNELATDSNCDEATNVRSSQMECRINQPIAKETMSHGASHAQLRSIVSQMQRSVDLGNQSSAWQESSERFMMQKKLSKRRFQCDQCGRCFRENDKLMKHRTIHTDKQPYECWLCHKKIRKKYILYKHMKIHTIPSLIRVAIDETKRAALLTERYGKPIDADQLKHKCHECGKLFSYKSALQRHMSTHTNKQPFECWLCHRTFKLLETLKSHTKVHLHEKKSLASVTESNWICEFCGQAYKGKQSLTDHVQRAHSDDHPHKCEQCDKRFKTRTSLCEHIRVFHQNRRFDCTQCDKTFLRKQSLKRHVEAHARMLAKPFVCDVCGKRFLAHSARMQHLHVHSDKKPYKCDHCDLDFRTRSSLKTHGLQAHGIFSSFQNRETLTSDPSKKSPLVQKSDILSFKCDTCGLGYRTKELLRKHQNAHTELQYKCTQCDRAFRQNSSLKAHMEIHTGVINKPIVCDVCGKGFRKNCDLTEHRRIHTGEKPFKCEHCALNFRTMSSFYGHLKKIHGISVSARNREERVRATELSMST